MTVVCVKIINLSLVNLLKRLTTAIKRITNTAKELRGSGKCKQKIRENN
jgi:hypothetical protein